MLTSALSAACEKLVALEVDERMLPALRESAPRAEVRLADALETDLGSVLRELPSPRGVASNLPYYITGPLLTRIAEGSLFWDKAVLMMQKEVADRVLAKQGDSDRGSLSVYLQAQFAIERVADVPPGAFLPPPKVSSTVLEFVPLRRDCSSEFFSFVRSGFKQPRKTLANNLCGLGHSRTSVLEGLASAGLDERVRPHELSLEDWVRLESALRHSEL